MPAQVTEAMIRAAYSQTPEKPVSLVTVETPSGQVFRYTDQPGGIVSRGQAYGYAAMNSAAGGAGPGEPSRRGRLVLGGTAAAALTPALRSGDGRPMVTGEEVRPAAPDVVETAFVAEVSESDLGWPVTELTLAGGGYKDEPACAPRYVIGRVPGLF